MIILFTTSCHSKSGNRKNFNNSKYTAVDANQIKGENLGTTINEEYINGQVIGIIDGDTYDLLIDGNQSVRIRMEGIDAPEKGMPFYQVSKKYLGDLCFNKVVKFIPTKKPDSNNRFIGFTYLDDGTELSHEMIKAGMAWHFKKFNADSDLSILEIDARTLKKGLWIDENPMAPWENRKLHRNSIPTKDSFNIEEINK